MHLSRNFYQNFRLKRDKRWYREIPIRNEKGRIVVPLVTGLFSSVPENMICTNTMYRELSEDIENSVDMYATREPVTINVFESEESSDFNRERILIGFRKYMSACQNSLKRQLGAHLSLFALFLIVGLALLYYTCRQSWMSAFVSKCAENIAAVFLWQFVGYMAFQFPGEIRAIQRCRQVQEAEFEYTLWE